MTPPDRFDAGNPSWATLEVLAYERVDRSTNLGSIAVISRKAGSMPCLVTPQDADYRNPSWAPMP